MSHLDERAITESGLLLSDASRVAILRALANGPLTVSELTARVGVPQPRVSSHLAILREAGWIEADSDGRQRRYRLADPNIVEALATLTKVRGESGTRTRTSRNYRRPNPHEPLRHARTCYDHLAGVAGVTVSDAFLSRGWIEPVTGGRGIYQPGFVLTDAGRTAMAERGVAIPENAGKRRRFAYACPDWTEPGSHIGGALGAAILQRLVDTGVVMRIPGDRTVRLGDNLQAWLDGARPHEPALAREFESD